MAKVSKAAYWQRGETIDFRNETSVAIEENTVVVIGKRIGITGMRIEPGEMGDLHVTGVFEFAKKSGEAISVGSELFFNPAEGHITTTEAAGTVAAGFAAAAAAAEASGTLVKING